LGRLFVWILCKLGVSALKGPKPFKGVQKTIMATPAQSAGVRFMVLGRLCKGWFLKYDGHIGVFTKSVHP
jgi:hypothetical protein